MVKGEETSWDARMLKPEERARVLRDGVAVGAVDPAALAALLGKKTEDNLREQFCTQWVVGWLPSYLESRREVFGSAPHDPQVGHSFFSRRTPDQQHRRQCGRVLIDGMRSLFGQAM